ncbi:MAG: hypothetical protein GTN74_10680 [Proteobacteria bacterium]|nr:hypothetical protein [Pseudomonadota bacterium]NIS70643.1 hypothetical protein [Pseudomonadota bacterium]
MNKRRYSSILVLAMIAGFLGGAVASRVFTDQRAFAQRKSNAAKLMEAQEFRLVDGLGYTRAVLTVRDGKVLAEIPDFTKWTIKFREEGKQKE